MSIHYWYLGGTVHRAFLVICLLGYSLGSIAATRYVSSESEAQSALDNASPGDTIAVKDGTYSDFTLVLNRSGTAEMPIIFRAESGGKVRFTGQSGFQVRGSHLIIDGFVFDHVTKLSDDITRIIRFEGAHYSEVVNCAFYSCGFYKWAHLILLKWGSTHNQIHHNYFENIRGQGIGVRGEADNTDNHIHHNRINGTWEDGEANGQEPIQIGQSQSHNDNSLNTVVEYNLIENMVGDADSELISNKTSGNYLRWNTFINNENTKELEVRGGSNCIVENNYFDGSGIRVYGNGHTIRNNYVKNAKKGIWFRGGDGNTYQDTYDCTVSGNLFVNSLEHGVLMGHQGRVVYDINLNDNKVFSHTSTMYAVDELTQNQFSWSGNVGEGHAALKSGIPSGVTRGTVDITPPFGPLSYQEVGPAWTHESTTNANDTWLEAECGEVGSTWEEKSDSNASGSSYVEIAPGNNSMSSAPDSASDRIDYQFEINKSGDYHLWGRLRTPSPSDDSFWIKVDDGPWSIWYTGVFTEWGWKKQRTHSLSAGTHQLSIAYREDGAQLDKLYLTSGNTTPVTTGPTRNFNCNVANAFPDPAKWYYLENKACSGNGQPKRLDTDNCSSVDVDPGSAQDKQWRFELTDDGSSYYLINRACNARLDSDNCETVDLSAKGSNDDKRWVVSLSEDGVHYLLNNKACLGKYLDADNCKRVDVSGGSQNDKRWKLIEAGSVNGREAVGIEKERLEEEVMAEELLVYPNPAQQTLQLRVPNHLPSGQLTLHDLQGRVVLQQKLSGSQTINIAHLPPGLYTVSLQLGDTVETRKLVIEK